MCVSSYVPHYNNSVCSGIVRVLVSHGADLNVHGGSDGWTPLFYAAMAGNSPLGYMHAPILIVKAHQTVVMLFLVAVAAKKAIEICGQFSVWCTTCQCFD